MEQRVGIGLSHLWRLFSSPRSACRWPLLHLQDDPVPEPFQAVPGRSPSTEPHAPWCPQAWPGALSGYTSVSLPHAPVLCRAQLQLVPPGMFPELSPLPRAWPFPPTLWSPVPQALACRLGVGKHWDLLVP